MRWITSTAAAVSSRIGRESAWISALRPTYDRVLDFLYAETGIPVQIGEETFFVCPRIRKFISIEPEVYDYLKGVIHPRGTVLDIGSFLGIYAILAARWIGTQGQVVAFEPTRASQVLLHRHLAMNRVQENVVTFACAVGRKHGVVEFFQHADAYLNSVAFRDPGAAGDTVAVRVPTLSVDEVCTMFALEPTVMRIDVQGYEAEVLQGAAQTIRKFPQVKIILEVHPQLWPLHNLNEKKFKLQLSDLGLRDSAPNGGPAAYFPDSHVVLTVRV